MLIAGAALAAVLIVAIFGRMMGYDVGRDEMLYSTPPAFLPGLRLYEDVFYNHVPYSAWAFRGVFVLTGGENLLFAGRLTVFVAWLLMAGAVTWLAFRLSGSAVLALFALIAVLTNDLLLGVTGMSATNNFLPLPFATLGLGLFLLAVLDGRPRAWQVFLAGLCLSFAAGLKASAVIFIPAATIAAVFLPIGLPFVQRLRVVVLPLAAGGVIGALPVLYLLATQTELFLAHVVGFHGGPHEAYWDANRASEPDLAMGLGQKLRLAFLIWLGGSTLILAFTTAYVAVLLLGGQRRADVPWGAWSAAAAVLIATTLLAVAMSFVPTPSFPQYFVLPLVCLPLLLALLYRQLSPEGRDASVPVLVTAAILMAVVALPRLGSGAVALLDPAGTTVAQTAQAGASLRGLLEERGLDDETVATLAPLYPLEGGLKVYPEFATGQFAYRVVPFTGPDLQTHYRAVGPAGLAGFLTAAPPGAILVGFEPELEAPFVAFAEENGYERITGLGIEDRYGEGVVYLRPDNSADNAE